ncbi:MAG: hypothetical protein M3R26_02405 [Actinomycetota bacterium]|nr:hypothetical protein [Actinomycetota bacterium]
MTDVEFVPLKDWSIAILFTAAIAVIAGCSSAYHATRTGKARPVPVQRVSWPAAKHQIRICNVKRVDTTHQRTVTLTLRNGRKLFTHEPPHVDEAVHEVVRVNNQRKCPPITLAME